MAGTLDRCPLNRGVRLIGVSVKRGSTVQCIYIYIYIKQRNILTLILHTVYFCRRQIYLIIIYLIIITNNLLDLKNDKNNYRLTTVRCILNAILFFTLIFNTGDSYCHMSKTQHHKTSEQKGYAISYFNLHSLVSYLTSLLMTKVTKYGPQVSTVSEFLSENRT